MTGYRWLIRIIIVVSFFSSGLTAQTVTVNQITFSGHKRTKESIILRELTFREGDTLLQKDLGAIMERNRNNLLNLGIFNDAKVNVSEWNTDVHEIEVTVEVKESWYVYLLPILELADRNFNVWWTTHNHALDRLNLGARLDYLNFSGRNDKLKALLQFGYTPKQEVEYRFPYFNKKQSIGMTMSASHSLNKEIRYLTLDNKEMFIKLDEDKLLDRIKAEVSWVYRPNLFLRYDLSLTYQKYTADRRITEELNPNYFRNGGTTNTAMITRIAGEYDDRDFKIYPARGMRAQIQLEKTGWGASDDENNLVSNGAIEWNFTSGRRIQHRFIGIGQYSLSRSRPSYLYYQGLGYSQQFIRGYELYVIDGLDVVIGKYQFAYKLYERKIKLGKIMPLPQFKEMPLQIYFSVLAETGRVEDPFTATQNPLANQWLYGGGPGLDFVLYHNFLFQINASTNHLGEWGLYLHNRTSF